MLLSLSLFILAWVFHTVAAPIPREESTDTQILQFALTLEHLETAFYTKGLNDFDDNAFVQAGLPDFTRGRFLQIKEHEATHVTLLSGILSDSAPQPCQYSFPFNDPKSFVALASVLENGGVSAYLGAASKIQDRHILTSTGAILTTEARQNAWIHSAVLKLEPWSRAFDTPLSANLVFSLAQGFITSCPSSNPTLSVKGLPALTVEEPEPSPGTTVTLQFDGDPTSHRLALLHGLNTTFVDITSDKKVLLPTDLQGTVYGVLTEGNEGQVTDENAKAGVVIFQFPFSSMVDNPN